MIHAIIFDYFGVIRPDRIFQAYRELGGDPEKDTQFIHDTIQALNRGFIPTARYAFAERLGVSEEEWIEAVTGRHQHDVEVLKYIESLRKRYKIGLLSNIGPGGLQTLWQPGELERYFDVAIASGDVGVVKPDPAIYEMTANKLGVKPQECVMIDDRDMHCHGAVAAGMQSILYKNLAQCKQELEKLLKTHNS